MSRICQDTLAANWLRSTAEAHQDAAFYNVPGRGKCVVIAVVAAVNFAARTIFAILAAAITAVTFAQIKSVKAYYETNVDLSGANLVIFFIAVKGFFHPAWLKPTLDQKAEEISTKLEAYQADAATKLAALVTKKREELEESNKKAKAESKKELSVANFNKFVTLHTDGLKPVDASIAQVRAAAPKDKYLLKKATVAQIDAALSVAQAAINNMSFELEKFHQDHFDATLKAVDETLKQTIKKLEIELNAILAASVAARQAEIDAANSATPKKPAPTPFDAKAFEAKGTKYVQDFQARLGAERNRVFIAGLPGLAKDKLNMSTNKAADVVLAFAEREYTRAFAGANNNLILPAASAARPSLAGGSAGEVIGNAAGTVATSARASVAWIAAKFNRSPAGDAPATPSAAAAAAAVPPVVAAAS